MNKRILFCILTTMTLQAHDVATQTETAKIEDIIVQLQKTHADIATLKAEVITLLTVMYEKLNAIEKARGIDFGAWNNLQEYEKYQDNNNEDYEEDYEEGEQE